GKDMNTHDIELPPLPKPAMNEGDTALYAAFAGSQVTDYARAAIEADRKRNDRMMAHEWIRPALRLEEDAPYRFDIYAQEIEKLKNDSDYRKRRGEPVKHHLKVSYDDKGDCLYVICDSNEPADAEEDDKGILY